MFKITVLDCFIEHPFWDYCLVISVSPFYARDSIDAILGGISVIFVFSMTLYAKWNYKTKKKRVG